MGSRASYHKEIMIYEFECSTGHVTEASVPMGTRTWPCAACIAEQKARPAADRGTRSFLATRILSPTRTTFVFADTHRR
jgi:hypothetical protein